MTSTRRLTRQSRNALADLASDAMLPAQKVLGALNATDHAHNMKITIRRCAGNRECWGAVCGPNDFLMETSYSLDRLVTVITERHGAQRIVLECGS